MVQFPYIFVFILFAAIAFKLTSVALDMAEGKMLTQVSVLLRYDDASSLGNCLQTFRRMVIPSYTALQKYKTSSRFLKTWAISSFETSGTYYPVTRPPVTEEWSPQLKFHGNKRSKRQLSKLLVYKVDFLNVLDSSLMITPCGSKHKLSKSLVYKVDFLNVLDSSLMITSCGSKHKLSKSLVYKVDFLNVQISA